MVFSSCVPQSLAPSSSAQNASGGVVGPEGLLITPVMPVMCGDPTLGVAVSGNLLWATHSRKTLADQNRVFAFDAKTLEARGSLEVPLLPVRIFPKAGGELVAVGRAVDQSQGGGSAVAFFKSSGQKPVPGRVIYPEAPPMYWAEGGGGQYLSGPTENVIFKSAGGSGWKPLPGELFGPSVVVEEGKDLLVLENYQVDFGDENVARLRSGVAGVTRLFQTHPRGQGITDLVATGHSGYLIANEMLTGNLLVIDRENMSAAARVAVGEGPRGLAMVGHCAVTHLAATGEIVFVDVQNPLTPVVSARWRVDSEAPKFAAARLAVDEAHRRVFLRRQRGVDSCSQVPEGGVIAVSEPGDRTFLQCLK
jgi:hypothetical protein